MRNALSLVIVAAALLAVVSADAVLAGATTVTCIYSLGPYGSASIKIKYYNPGGILVLTVPLEKNALTSTILVYNENGTPLDFTLKGGEAVIDAANSTTVWIEYSAVVGNTTDNIVNATIHPVGPATVYLPRGAALLGFNGTAVVDYVSDRIVLRYGSKGAYNIVYLVPPTTTTSATVTTTSTTPTTTTTSSTTTTTPPATTTSTTPKTTPTTSTTVSTSTTTTSPRTTVQKTTTTSTAKTTQPTRTTTSSTTASSTSATPQASQRAPGPAATTGKSTGAETAVSKKAATATPPSTPGASSTTTTPIRRSNKAQIVATIVTVIAVIIVLALVLTRRRGGGAEAAGSFIDGASPGSGGGASAADVTLVSSSLDERDKAILDLLSREGPLGVSEVARRLGISKSTAWRKLQKLVDMGLVERVVVNGTPLYRAKKQ